MLVRVRLRHVANKVRGTERYVSVTHLTELQKEVAG